MLKVTQSSLSLASKLRQLSLAGPLMADKVISLPKRPATPWSTYYGNNFAKVLATRISKLLTHLVHVRRRKQIRV